MFSPLRVNFWGKHFPEMWSLACLFMSFSTSICLDSMDLQDKVTTFQVWHLILHHTHLLTFPTHNSRAEMSTETMGNHFSSAQDESSDRWLRVSAFPLLLLGDSNYTASKQLSETLPLSSFIHIAKSRQWSLMCCLSKHSILIKANEKSLGRSVD